MVLHTGARITRFNRCLTVIEKLWIWFSYGQAPQQTYMYHEKLRNLICKWLWQKSHTRPVWLTCGLTTTLYLYVTGQDMLRTAAPCLSLCVFAETKYGFPFFPSFFSCSFVFFPRFTVHFCWFCCLMVL